MSKVHESRFSKTTQFIGDNHPGNSNEMRQDADLEAIMASGKFNNQAEKYLFDVTHFYIDTYEMKEPQRQMFIMDTNTQDTPYQMINQLLAIERGTLEAFVGVYSDYEEYDYEEEDYEEEDEKKY